MPLPLILGIGAAIAAIGGVGAGIHGGVKMKEAKDTMEEAQCRHEKNVKKFEEQNKQTTEVMDELGKLELEIVKSFYKTKTACLIQVIIIYPTPFETLCTGMDKTEIFFYQNISFSHFPPCSSDAFEM